jgi:malonyl-CoA decarboxylase
VAPSAQLERDAEPRATPSDPEHTSPAPSRDGPAEQALSRAARNRVEELLGLLQRIQADEDPSRATLKRFQDRYLELPREDRPAFFETTLCRMEVRKESIGEELRGVIEHEEDASVEWSRLMTALRRRVESPRMRAFRCLPNGPGGFKFLLDLRADVLTALRHTSLDLEPLSEELAHLFTSWFQQGFLFLQEITRDSSFRQIQFLKEHDLVHPMARLEEMEARLGTDRRCFALYHRAMPEEPVVFIEAALTHGITRSIHEIIGDAPRPPDSRREPDTAIFYSISNTQDGLAGLGLGRVLVFQVIEAVKQRNPGIKSFATLSPIPGFWKRYLRPILAGDDGPFLLKRGQVDEFFPESARKGLLGRLQEREGASCPDLAAALLQILGEEGWIEDPALVRWLRKPLTQLTYHYLTAEKNKQGSPLNPVANFHLSNGARLNVGNVDFGANRSPRGLGKSCGMMVNYVYSRTWLQKIGRSVRSLLPWNS